MIHFVTWVQSFDKGSLGLEISLTSITLKLINNLEYGAGEFSNPDSIPVNVDTEDDIEALIRIR